MAKTIGQLTELAATPDSTDIVPIEDGGVTKKISVSNLTAATLGLTGNKTVAAGTNLALATTTGTKIGTATNQLLGFWNATPVDQPALTADLLDSLQEVGLIASGAGNTPLDLSAGALGCGTITLTDAANIVVNTTTGSKIGTSTTQKIGFWNAAPAVQPAAVANLTVTASSGTLPTPDGSVTVNATTPTVAQLLEYCVEIEDKLEDLLGKLRTIGLIAT
jgi:hypothetical protein